MADEQNGGTPNPDGGQKPEGQGGLPQGGAPNANGGGQQPVGGAPQGGTKFEYQEDRSDWLPKHRFDAATGKLRQQVEKLEKDLKSSSTDLQTRIKQAFGIDTPGPEDQEAAAIKAALLKVMPNLAVLEKLSPEKLDEILAGVESGTASTEQYWQRHAETMLGDLETGVAKSIGIEKLSDKQKRQLHVAYREEGIACAQARDKAAKAGESYDATNDFLSRHERGDKTLIAEFGKAFVDEWFGPARRVVTAESARRLRPTPNGGRGDGIPKSKLPDVNLNDDDAFKKALLEARGQS